MKSLLLPLVAAVALVATACTDQAGGALPFQSGGSKTAAERELEQEVRSLSQVTRDIVVSNTVQGALFGAGAGCGLALIFGGDGDDCVRGGVAGGVVGGVAGNQIGREAAAVNQELVRQDQIIANLQGINSQLNTVAVSLRDVVRTQNEELSSLRRQLANEQVSASAYNARVRAINSNRQTVIQGLQASEANVAESYNELVALEQESGTRLRAPRQQALSTRQRIASLRNSVSLVPTQ